MLLPRRRLLALSLSALAMPALIGSAQASCRPVDLKKGIVFKRKDGSTGLARRESDGAVVIDYVTNRGDWLDRRRVVRGVFEIGRLVQESEFPVVGATAPGYRWTYSPKPVWLEDGMTWNGKVKEVMEVTISDANSTVQRDRTRWVASYRCFEPREVTLSGCVYKVLTVEGTFVGPKGSRTQRWVYFPEYSFALETRRDGVSNGITSLLPA